MLVGVDDEAVVVLSPLVDVVVVVVDGLVVVGVEVVVVDVRLVVVDGLVVVGVEVVVVDVRLVVVDGLVVVDVGLVVVADVELVSVVEVGTDATVVDTVSVDDA